MIDTSSMNTGVCSTPLSVDETLHVCAGCNDVIVDRYLCKVQERVWHEQCVRCNACNTRVQGKCHVRDSNIYCKDDFQRLFGVKCFACSLVIRQDERVRRLASRIFHVSCLRCSFCNREAVTGDRLYPYHSSGGFLCRADHDKNKGLADKKHVHTHDCMNKSDESNTEKSPNSAREASDDDDDVSRRRGPRTTIKAKQLDMLKASFLNTPKPSRHVREKLAQDTGLTMRVIQVWFQNRRSKERRVKHLSNDSRVMRNKEEADMFHYYQNTGNPLPPGHMDEFRHRNFGYNPFRMTPAIDEQQQNMLSMDTDMLLVGQGHVMNNKKQDPNFQVNFQAPANDLNNNGFNIFPSPIIHSFQELT